ncbi:MAG: hypothetical protein IT454_06440 [Planctomycetes bacterium]|nr:hypothetical protein [Planctomycetota bacterium]
MSQYTRSRILISALQARLMMLSFVYLVALALCLGAVIFWPLVARLNDDTISAAARSDVAHELLRLHARFWPGFAVIGAIYIVHQMYVTHRIAGPIYRLRVTMRDITEGRLPRAIHLRKGDMLIEEADEMNRMLTAARGHVESTKELQTRVSAALRRLSESRELGPDVRGHADWQELNVAASLLEHQLASIDLAASDDVADEPSGSEPPAALPRSGAKLDARQASERPMASANTTQSS